MIIINTMFGSSQNNQEVKWALEPVKKTGYHGWNK